MNVPINFIHCDSNLWDLGHWIQILGHEGVSGSGGDWPSIWGSRGPGNNIDLTLVVTILFPNG
jgi:hypothetical protein